MMRVTVVVEGQTEESFVKDVLAPELWPRQVFLTPIIIGVPGQKGGRTNYARLKKDVMLTLKQDSGVYCSTMIDFYGLGSGFPGLPVPANTQNLEKVRQIERAVKEDIVAERPDLRPDVRFLPYLQLHEFEGLLFSDPVAFASGIGEPRLASRLQGIRNQFETPEDINDDPNTAPSKQVINAHPPYRKVLNGVQAARAVGIARMRQECPHFRNWLEQLEALGS
jgi:hypothetical protein